jgi:NADH dehydrogenase [ubiquinone] 1 alpha subcomplex assembly factor 7
MRQCLTSDLGGYYTSSPPEKDQFGAKGDFVTSPEISQVFGELIGVWVVAEWIAQGRKSEGVYLMEVGPGRGTLMDDMLRTIRNFPPLAKAVEAVYMVEASPNLRAAQHKLLCGDNTLEETKLGWQSVSKHSPDLKIIWTEDIRFVPKEASKTPFIIAHEFFDALPIHIFQSVPPAPQNEQNDNTIQTPTGPIPMPRRLPQASQTHQWRELVVSPKAPHKLKEGEPEFELSMAKAGTPHSMYLPETSPRYQALKDTTDATIEISPESQAYTRDFAERLGGSNPVAPAAAPKPQPIQIPGRAVPSGPAEVPFEKPEPSGAALIIDYGPANKIPANSFRGIRAHKFVSPFESAGVTDLSADVDFLALAESAINGSPGVEVHGPVDQARFLTSMGIEERAAQLVKRAVDKERGGSTGADKSELTEIVKRIDGGWKRLVDSNPEGMGKLYQVMAILPYKPGKQGEPRRRPVGFGGDVSL